ncbi:MAG: FecCD family ABC transporter permease [Acidobacteriota bacterium]
MHTSSVRTGTVLAVLVLALMCTVILGIACGAVHIPLHSIAGALFGLRPLSLDDRVILFDIRLPRILASAMVGAALSAAGLLFQGLFRNPLADPYVIGSSGGAVLGATIGLVLLPQVSWLGFSAVALLAFAGSVATIAVVYSLARVGGTTQVVTLLLAGFAVSTMLSYSSYFVEVLDRDYGLGLRVLASWLHGSVATPEWKQLVVLGVLLACSLVGAAILSRRLNTLALGEEYAQQLGVQVERVRIAIILTGSLLAAVAVSLGGLIGFVGLIVPHLARLIAGPDHVRLLPITVLTGASFLILTDTLARTILAPSELPVGILMAFVGGPFFLYLLRRTKRGYTV